MSNSGTMKNILLSLKLTLTLTILIISFWLGGNVSSQSPVPLVAVRFANPEWNASLERYYVDVEFRSDSTDVQVFGMNVRFFYDDTVLEFEGFDQFEGGYAAFAPNPPHIQTSPAGPGLFGFGGPADFVNGAVQLVNTDTTPIVLDTVLWTKLYRVCFAIDDANPNVESFCPSIVWDMEANPANGGFLVADDGVVITIVNHDPSFDSAPALENVVQFNWKYIGSGGTPWGEPVEEVCIPLGVPLLLSVPGNMNLECTESTDPSVTGYATAVDDCAGEIVITYSDEMAYGECNQNFMLTRTWTASNGCETVFASQQIQVQDSIAPTCTIAPLSWLNHLSSDTTTRFNQSDVGILEMLNTLNESSIIVSDGCDAQITTVFTINSAFAVDCIAEGYAERRIYSWLMTDACGNTTDVNYTVEIMDDVAPVLTGVPADEMIICEQLPSVPQVHSDDSAVTILFTETIVEGIQPGTFDVIRKWSGTDPCGNTTTSVQNITWRPESLLACTIQVPKRIACNSDKVIIKSSVIGSQAGVTYSWELVGVGCYILGGQGTSRIIIHIGNTPVNVILTLTDQYGCEAVCSTWIECSQYKPLFIRERTSDQDSLSNEIELDEILAADQQSIGIEAIKAWPNPTAGQMNISFDSRQAGVLQVGIYNILGQEVKREQVNCQAGVNTWRMDLSDLQDGNYYLRFSTELELITKVIVLVR